MHSLSVNGTVYRKALRSQLFIDILSWFSEAKVKDERQKFHVGKTFPLKTTKSFSLLKHIPH